MYVTSYVITDVRVSDGALATTAHHMITYRHHYTYVLVFLLLSGMLVNSTYFGTIVRRARGERSQESIDTLGGPPRQRQAAIENGHPIEISSTVAAQLEAAYRWAPGTVEALTSQPRPPADLAQRLDALPSDALAVGADGQPVPMPPMTSAASARDLLPLIRRWRGPILIDATAAPDLLENWEIWADIDRRRVHRTGTATPTTSDAIAIDPIDGIRTYGQAKALMSAVDRMRTNRPELWNTGRHRRAFTLLYLAAISDRRTGGGLTALSDLRENWNSPDPDWERFYKASGLSSRFQNKSDDLLASLDGLLALRDFHVDVELVADDDNPRALRLNPTSTITTVPIQDLDNTMVAYDSDACTELPAILDWAYDARNIKPLMIVSAFNHPPGRPWHTLRFANSHLVIIDHGESAGAIAKTTNTGDSISGPPTRTPYAVWTSPRPGSAGVLVPGNDPTQTPQKPTCAWISTVGNIVSNQHLGHSSGATVGFYRAHRDDFGTFVSARLHSREDPVLAYESHEPPQLTLIDHQANELRLWGLSCGYLGQGSIDMAQILTDAGFGDTEHMKVATRIPHEWPHTLYRPNPNLTLTLGHNPETSQPITVDLTPPNSHILIDGNEPDVRTEMVTAALLRLTADRSPHELVILGMTTQTPRNWTPIAQLPHTLRFAGPATATRDPASILRWFNNELKDEIHRRQQQARSQTQRPPSKLLIVVDSATDIEHVHAVDNALKAAPELALHVVYSTNRPPIGPATAFAYRITLNDRNGTEPQPNQTSACLHYQGSTTDFTTLLRDPPGTSAPNPSP